MSHLSPRMKNVRRAATRRIPKRRSVLSFRRTYLLLLTKIPIKSIGYSADIKNEKVIEIFFNESAVFPFVQCNKLRLSIDALF